MKRKATLFILMAAILMAIGASVSAFDPCIKYHYIATNGNYRYCRASMYPGENTYPHAHRVTAYLYIDGVLWDTAASDYESGPVYAFTDSYHYSYGDFSSDADFECPVP